MPIICLVTDRAQFEVIPTIRAAAQAGVDLVQIRERGLDDRALYALTCAALDEVAGTSTRVIVNERLDVAILAGAHGVHLRGDSMPAARVRGMVPREFLITRSVHGQDEAAAVDREGAVDLMLFGTVFPSAGKPAGHQSAGVGALARICATVRTPVLAIGGIDPARARAAVRAGAAGVAAIGLFARGDVSETVAALRRAFDTRSQVV